MMPSHFPGPLKGNSKYCAVGIMVALIVSSHLLLLKNPLNEIDPSGMVMPPGSSSSMEKHGRNESPMELPFMILNGTMLTYEDKEITLNGNISIINSSRLIFRNCRIFMSPENETSGGIFIDLTSSLEMENTTLTSGGPRRYDIQCSGILNIKESRIESFHTISLSNSTVLVESSQLVMENGSLHLNNSDLILLDTSLDHDSLFIEGSSEVHIREFAHVEIYSSYMGPVELATVVIKDGTGKILTTGKSDNEGTFPGVILERVTLSEGNAVHHGPFSFNVTHPKYYPNRTVVSISGESFVNITLKPILGHITGRVTFSEGIGIPDALVGNGVVECWTDENGSFLLDVFAKTTYTIFASGEHYSTEYRPGTYVGAGKFLVLNFTLKEDPPPFAVPFLENSTYRVSFNSTLTVEFLSELDPETVNLTTVLLYYRNDNTTITVKRVVELGENRRFVHVTPLFDLEQFSLYELVLKKEIRSVEGGEAIWRDFSYSFKTGYAAVMATVPEKDERDVGIYPTITIELTIPVSEITLNSSTVFLMDEKGNKVYREVSSAGGNTIVLEKSKVLAYNTTYTVTILSDLLDADGNPVFPHGYSFSFSTLREKQPPILTISITGEDGKKLPLSTGIRLSLVNLDAGTGINFSMEAPRSGIVTLSNLTAGSYNISVSAPGYERKIIQLLIHEEKVHNITVLLKRTEEKVNGGRTDLRTIVVILVIMGMFLRSIVIMGARRWRDVAKGGRKENIMRSSAPGMDAFEYRINPEIRSTFSKNDSNEDGVTRKNEDIPPGGSDREKRKKE